MLRRILFLIPGLLLAHPMGNFSVSHYTRIEMNAHGADVRYALDLAEVPTFELLRDWKLEKGSPREDLLAKANQQMRTWLPGLDFRADSKAVVPEIESVDIVLSDGAAGLPVAHITAKLKLAGIAPGTLTFEDRNFAERAGWKEIVIASANGATLSKTSHSSDERSKGLTAYPADPLAAPPQDLRAALTWTALPVATPQSSEPKVVATNKIQTPVVVPIPQPTPTAVSQSSPSAANPAARKQAGEVTKGDYLSRLLSNKELSASMIFLGLLVAFGIGAVHATSPGHGKTLVAAYLVGSKGTTKHAVILGAMTTFTHTISVFALGLVTLFLSQYILPETLLPWLGAISGLSIVAVGGSLFYKRFRKLRRDKASHSDAPAVAHLHSHDHSPADPKPHVHSHADGHTHDHDHDHAHAHAQGIAHSHAPKHEHSHDHDHAHGIAHSHAAKHDHDHDHAHAHAHGIAHTHPAKHDHGHSHAAGLVHDHGDGNMHSHDVPEEITIGGLIALGASGGLVPCPSALVLLLTSIALGRIGLGLLLLTSFSLGLASVLVGIGLLVLYAKSFLPQSKRITGHPAFQLVPVLSAAAIVIIGCLMTGVSLGWVRGFSA